MPNTTVRAAAEGMPNINRRRMLLGLAAASTAAAAVAVATPVPAAVHDPLLDAIRAYRDGIAAFNATGKDLSDAENNALFDIYVTTVQTALDEWVGPALTQAGAVEARRLAQEEADLYANSPMLAPMVQAALGFLQANTVTVALPAAAPSRSKLVDLIGAHKAAYAAFCAAINPADEQWCVQNGIKFTKAATLRWERTNRAEHRATMAICRFHTSTAAEGRMKANYLLKFNGCRDGYGELTDDQQRHPAFPERRCSMTASISALLADFHANHGLLQAANDDYSRRNDAYRAELARLGMDESQDLANGWAVAKRMGVYGSDTASEYGAREVEIVEAVFDTPSQSIQDLASKALIVRRGGVPDFEPKEGEHWTADELEEKEWSEMLLCKLVVDIEALAKKGGKSVTPNKRYTLDDLQYQATNIHQLLETIHDQILEMDFGTGAGRNHQLDRVSALVCVARDYSENVCESISTHYDAIQSKGRAA